MYHLPVLIHRRRVGPALQQQRHHRAVPQQAGQVERRVEVVRLVARPGPLLQEQRRHLEVTVLGRPVEGGVKDLGNRGGYGGVGWGRVGRVGWDVERRMGWDTMLG